MKESERVIKFESWLYQFCKTNYEKQCFEDWKKELIQDAKKEILEEIESEVNLSKGDWSEIINIKKEKLK